MQGVNVDCGLGEVRVVITNDRQRHIEEWAKLATDRILSCTGDVHPEIRQQAETLHGQIFSVVKNYIMMAVEEQKTCDAVLADVGGAPELGQAIRRI